MQVVYNVMNNLFYLVECSSFK